MRLKSLIILTLAFVACFSSCKKAPMSTGKIVTQTRDLPSFNKVILNDDISLTLVLSDTCYIEITTGENIIDNITTDVVNKTLTLSNTTTLDFIRDFDYELHATLYYNNRINNFIYSSSGDINTQNQYNLNDTTNHMFRFEVAGGSGNVDLLINNCKYFYVVYQHGTADIKIHGDNNKYLKVYKRSYGDFDARDYKAKKIDIENHSTGDCYIWATDIIYARILNLGDIYYKGTPSSITCEYGENARGRLIKL